MNRLVIVVVCALVFPSLAQAESLIGVTLGSPSAKGNKSNTVHSDSASYSFIYGVNGTGDFSFESGYTQLVDITNRVADGQKLESSIDGIYISGRYAKQFNDNSFGYAKLGVYRWTADITEKESNSTSNDDTTLRDDKSHSISGYSPVLALGVDFLVGDKMDFGLRVEFEHIDNIAGGARLKSQGFGRSVSEAYEYNRFAIGVVMAL